MESLDVFELLYKCAEKLGGAVHATSAAPYAGPLPNPGHTFNLLNFRHAPCTLPWGRSDPYNALHGRHISRQTLAMRRTTKPCQK
eukprot:scaffold649_cov347-Pavlova_lutheri.AAC.36